MWQALQALREPAYALGRAHVELRHIGLDVEHRRAVEHVVAGKTQHAALHHEQAHDGDAAAQDLAALTEMLRAGNGGDNA